MTSAIGAATNAALVASVARVFNVVGFAGSLRRGSYNRALLRAATELAPPALNIVIHELDGIPLYNASLNDRRCTWIEAANDAIRLT